MENGAPSEGKDPSAFLSEIIGAPVTVKLNSGVVYKGAKVSRYAFPCLICGTCADIRPLGELQSVDGYMNIALEKTEEFVNGVKRRSYGDAFVRGNNGELGSHPSLGFAWLTSGLRSVIHFGGFLTESNRYPSIEGPNGS
jgi:small nuclear ribonucleoprotein (snRNP)-like protein